MIRTKGEAGTGDVIEAVRHARSVLGEIRRLTSMVPEEMMAYAKANPEAARKEAAQLLSAVTARLLGFTSISYEKALAVLTARNECHAAAELATGVMPEREDFRNVADMVRPPDDPELTGAVFAVDSESRYHLGLEGPRLPSRHDIVDRRLWLLGIWDPLDGELSGLTLTVRTQVFE